MLIDGRLKKLVSALAVGAFVFSLPVTSDAKRIHDPKVDTKSEARQTSKKSKTVKVDKTKTEKTGSILRPSNVQRTNRPSVEFELIKYPAVSIEPVESIETLEQFEQFEQFELPQENSVPQTVSVYDTSISGTPIASQEQCVRYLLNNNPYPNLPVSAEEIVSYYYEEGAREGIRPDVAFAQALKETGFFRYGGDVIPEQNNYCGLGTTGGGVKGEFFATPQMGVRAHIQHLLAYSSTRRPFTPVIDPRYDIVRKAYGSRTLGNWQDLNGRWAVPGKYYGQEILSMFKSILMQ